MDYDNDQDRRGFQAMLNATFSMYGKADPAPPVVKMYFTALSRYTLEEVKEALNRHVVDTDQGQFIPKPADIVRNISGNTATQAEVAWAKVDKAIRSVGPHQSVCFDDSIIHAVITDMGGWIELCKVDQEEYPFKHNEFVKRYRGYLARPPAQVVNRLIGTTEGYNRRSGFHVDPPTFIGNREQALLMYRTGNMEAPKQIHRSDEIGKNVLKKLK